MKSLLLYTKYKGMRLLAEKVIKKSIENERLLNSHEIVILGKKQSQFRSCLRIH